MALKALNSVAGFSVGEIPNIVIDANGNVSSNNFSVARLANLGPIGNITITGGTAGQVIQTDGSGGLTWATIDTWRLQNGTSNVQVLQNGNVTVTVAGNANVVTFTSTGANVEGYLSVNGTISANGNISANNYLVTPSTKDLIVAPSTQLTRFYSTVNPYSTDTYDLGNALARWNNLFVKTATIDSATITGTATIGTVRTDNLAYANGQPWDLQQAAGSNTQIQYNDGSNNFGASANFTYNDSTRVLTVTGNIVASNANLGNAVTANYFTGTLTTAAQPNITSVGTLTSLTVGNATANTVFGNGTITATGNASFGNLTTSTATITTGNITTINSGLLQNGNSNVTITANGNVTINAVGGARITATSSGANITGSLGVSANLSVVGNIANANNISATNTIFANNANITANLTSGNANLGNLATANYINVSNTLNGNVASFTGNITALNANLGNLATANYVNVASNINVTGNVNAGNLVGTLANGTSNIRIASSGNVTVSIAGTSNIATFTGNTLQVVGNIQSTAGNLLANGNVTANGFLNGANANVTGEVAAGSVKTASITATSGNITISAAGTDQNVNINPTGTGVVDVSMHKITNLATPTSPTDATNKEYVDSLQQGLIIHTPVRVEANTSLNGTYAVGGTTQTTTTISGGTTITFSSNHGLSVNDGIVWTNSFNGIVGGEAYWVYSVPALNQITVKDGYYGAQVTTLTNGTGLTQASRANPGVGATLTNSGGNAALNVDGIALAINDRVLVYEETNAAYNGIYVVTNVGSPTTAWVLTRASDMNKYIPNDTQGMSSGSYVFIQQGNHAGESYVLTVPQGEIIIGTDNIEFTQFQAAGSYTAGDGLSLTGTTFTANVDNVTTAIVGGNIAVKAGANLTTPNLGDATFSSLTWNNLSNGNVTANNLSVTNLANVSGNVTIGGKLQVNGTISSNANVSGSNLTTGGNVTATGNVVAGNVTANSTVFAANANVSGTTITNALTVNNAITGNTANFSGAATVSSLTVNNAITGNTANFSGNVVVPNLTVNLAITGNTANFSGNVSASNWLTVSNTASVGNLRTDNLLYANGQPWDMQQAAGSNTQIQFNSNNDFGASANFTYNTSTNELYLNGTANVSTSLTVGNTAVLWGSATTTSVTANQTIASLNATGVTGVEFLVKGVDSSGSKYSIATVQAVTDGLSVDYATFGTVYLGGGTGTLAVNISSGFIRLQVTPSSSNSTVWTTQARTI